MGSKLDAMKAASRKALEHGPISEPSVSVPEKSALGKALDAIAKTPVGPVIQPPIQVVYRCKHTEPIKAFLAGDCPRCRNQARAAKATKNHEKKQAKHAAKPAIGRLPDSAVFSAIYNAATETWTGTLTINAVTFRATASGLQKGLLSELDRQYRESLSTEGAV